ncbi:coagulation factor X-like [Heterodontus francisci]|uniref:coagulation factor X-like n=1 Tax=Heterodontus francisci TaxID=7792 RepID=UPI00355C00D5
MNVILKSEKIFLLLIWSCQVNCLFLQKSHASTFLSRTRRANVGLEEVMQNNQERECFEEKCSPEEAQEIARDNLKTEQFRKTHNGTSDEDQDPLPRGVEDGLGKHIPPEEVLSNVTASVDNDTLSALVYATAGLATGSIEHLPCILNQTLREDSLKTIFNIGKEILERRKEAVQFHLELLNCKQNILERVKRVLEQEKYLPWPK